MRAGFLPRKQPALSQHRFVKLALQPIPQQKPRIRRVPNPKAPDRLLIQPPPGQILPRPRPLRPAQAFLKESTGALVDIKQHRSQLSFFRLGRAAKAGFREKNVPLLRDRSHRLRKSNVLDFLHEAKHIARRPTPKAVKELPRGMHRERRRLLAMKRTQPRKILRPRLLQLDVIADHANDVRLLLERVSEIARVSHHEELSRIIAKHCFEWESRDMHPSQEP